MKWRKLGKIFDPTQYQLPNNCVEFAQSPQVLVFDDFVRIYFSTREKDSSNGKFKSHIAFVDFDLSFQKILHVSTNPVIALGDPGCFDEHGIFPINVLRDEDRILAYTCGWSRRVSVSVETSTGLAISYDNGLTFQKTGSGPVFSNSLHEPFLVGDSFVQKYNNTFHMWYIYGQRWINNPSNDVSERVYKIAHAFSEDGIEWQRDGKAIISDKINKDECQALPSVLFHYGKYHMYFCFRDVFGFRTDRTKAYRLGYAYSSDLINWTRADELSGIDITEGDWDGDMMCYPHIFECQGNIYLLYNGNEFGRYGFGLAMLENEEESEIIFEDIEIKLNTASEIDIKNHLDKSNESFIPPLSERVNIEEYSKKIKQKALTFEAWVDHKLIALIALYKNENDNIGYITSVSVLPFFKGKRITSRLLDYVIKSTTDDGFNKIQLEVNKSNIPAISLYKKYHFAEYSSNEESLFFELSLHTSL